MSRQLSFAAAIAIFATAATAILASAPLPAAAAQLGLLPAR